MYGVNWVFSVFKCNMIIIKGTSNQIKNRQISILFF